MSLTNPVHSFMIHSGLHVVLKWFHMWLSSLAVPLTMNKKFYSSSPFWIAALIHLYLLACLNPKIIAAWLIFNVWTPLCLAWIHFPAGPFVHVHIHLTHKYVSFCSHLALILDNVFEALSLSHCSWKRGCSLYLLSSLGSSFLVFTSKHTQPSRISCRPYTIVPIMSKTCRSLIQP